MEYAIGTCGIADTTADALFIIDYDRMVASQVGMISVADCLFGTECITQSTFFASFRFYQYFHELYPPSVLLDKTVF